MKQHRITLRVGQVRKYNTYLTNCANRTISPTLKIMILAAMIDNSENGHIVLKG